MIIPLRLYRYLARHVLLSFLTALGIIFSVVFILELLNVMKETSSSQSIGFPVIMQLTILKIPATLEQVSHFAVLIGGMISLVKLTKTSELIIARASGVSVWQFLLPGIVSIYLVGVFFTTVFNPISAAMLSRYEQLEARKIKGKTSTLSVSPSGLWLKQINTENPEKSEEIIHALRISQRDMLLYDVIVFMFDANGNFTKRVDAETAKLDGNKWIFKNLLITSPSSSSERMDMAELPTTFSLEQIQGSFASPDTLSFWKLGSFISTLESTGFSAIPHRMHWHWILSRSFMFCGMLLIAAVFSLRLIRGRSMGILVTCGILSGFVIYFLSNVIYALGLSGTLPVFLAAWAPAIITNFIGISALLHFEDG